jgi:hypothetical protein
MNKCKWCGNELKTNYYRNRFHCDHCNRMVTQTGEKVLT